MVGPFQTPSSRYHGGPYPGITSVHSALNKPDIGRPTLRNIKRPHLKAHLLVSGFLCSWGHTLKIKPLFYVSSAYLVLSPGLTSQSRGSHSRGPASQKKGVFSHFQFFNICSSTHPKQSRDAHWALKLQAYQLPTARAKTPPSLSPGNVHSWRIRG